MDQWTAKLDTYLDGELSTSDVQALDAHLRTCPSCAADMALRLQFKRAVRLSGKRYAPSVDFRRQVREDITTRSRRSPLRAWLVAATVFVVLLAVVAAILSIRHRQLARRQVFGEIADLHVATLASANPIDVVSSDRHTVKPWFQGKIPFSFNLPELQNSDFTLIGGRVAYLRQAPGAELIYQIRKHQISVFIFQDRQVGSGLPTDAGTQKRVSFNVESWSLDGLRYFVIGDAGAGDIRSLALLFKHAAQS